MTEEQELDYFKTACAICGIGMDIHHADLIISIFKHIKQKKGKSNLDSILDIKHQIEIKYKENEPDENL